MQVNLSRLNSLGIETMLLPDQNKAVFQAHPFQLTSMNWL